MGRLGTIGGDQQQPTSSGGRLGKIKFEPQRIITPKISTPTITGIPQSIWDKMTPKAQENLKATAKQVEASKAGSAMTFGNLAKEVGKNIVGAGKTAVDILNPIPEAVSLYKQATIGAKVQPLGKGSGLMSPELVKNQTEYIKSEVKKGTISKEKGQQEINKLNQSVAQKQTQLAKAEKEQGVKFSQDEGVFNLLNTAANVAGVAPIIKGAKKLVGKGVELTTGKIAKTAEDITRANVEKEIGVKLTDSQAKSLAENVPKKEAPISKAEQITAPSDLLVSHEGAPDKITVGEYKTKIQNGETIEPIKVIREGEKYGIEDGKHRYEAYKQLGIKDVPIEIVEPTGIKPIGEMKISGNALRIQENAVEKKLVDKMSDLPEYKTINMKEQAQESLKLINEDKQKAIDIIEGKINPPGNLKAQSVHQALEDLAMREGDGELLTKLAKSHINTELSESAQKMRIAAERDPHSPVEQIRQLQETRAKASQRRYKTTINKEKANASKIISKATPKVSKETWASFVRKLEC